MARPSGETAGYRSTIGAFGRVSGRGSPSPTGTRCIPPDPGAASPSVRAFVTASQRPSGVQEGHDITGKSLSLRAVPPKGDTK